MPNKKYEKQYPSSDSFVRNLGRIQVTLNCLYDYRYSLQSAYELLVQVRTLRYHKGTLTQMCDKDRRQWYELMKTVRHTINRARVKKSYFDAHLHGHDNLTPISPSVYFDIGATRVKYPYKEVE